MRFNNGNSASWSWRQSADVSSDGKRNTTAVTQERPCVPRLLLRQQLTHPSHAASCAPVEGHKAREGEEQEKAPALLLRRRGHNRPQCGRFRGRGLTLFCGLTSLIDADSLKSRKNRRYCRVCNDAITE